MCFPSRQGRPDRCRATRVTQRRRKQGRPKNVREGNRRRPGRLSPAARRRTRNAASQAPVGKYPGKITGRDTGDECYIEIRGARGRLVEKAICPTEVLTSPRANMPHCWRDGSYGVVPEGAVRAGRDRDGDEIYVGRAWHEGDLIPAKIVPNKGCAYVAFAGGEHEKGEYEVLCDAVASWVDTAGGDIPDGAVAVGQTSDGERLYIGRVMHDGAITPGKVHPSHGVCYIPFGGEELSFPHYEILVLR